MLNYIGVQVFCVQSIWQGVASPKLLQVKLYNIQTVAHRYNCRYDCKFQCNETPRDTRILPTPNTCRFFKRFCICARTSPFLGYMRCVNELAKHTHTHSPIWKYTLTNGYGWQVSMSCTLDTKNHFRLLYKCQNTPTINNSTIGLCSSISHTSIA